MIKILTIALDLKDVSVLGMTVSGEVVAVGICFAITVLYAVAAGHVGGAVGRISSSSWSRWAR
jgi:hypothetical protein